jgi:DNA-binding beta-propeller fold protein YncE
MRRVRRPRLLAGLAVIVVLAGGVFISGVVQSCISFFLGPRVISAGPEPNALAISPDGRTLYAADYGDGTTVPNSGASTVTPVSLLTGKPGKAIYVGHLPVQMVIGANDELYVLLDPEWSSGEIIPVNLATGARGAAMAFPGRAMDLEASSDRRTLYVLTGSGGVIPVDVATGRRGRPLGVPGHENGIADTAVSPDGRTLWTVIEHPDDKKAGEVVPVDIRTGHAGPPVFLANSPVAPLTFSPDGKSLYVLAGIGYGDDEPLGPQNLFVVAAASGKVVKTVTFGVGVQVLAVAPDGRTVYVQNQDTSVTPVSTLTWDLEATIHSTHFMLLSINAGLTAPLATSSLVISPDGRTMYDANGTGVAVMPLSG